MDHERNWNYTFAIDPELMDKTGLFLICLIL